MGAGVVGTGEVGAGRVGAMYLRAGRVGVVYMGLDAISSVVYFRCSPPCLPLPSVGIHYTRSRCPSTCSQVLAAAAAAPEPAPAKARRALVHLPHRFIMDGFCVYAGDASEQQLQRWEAAADRRTEADKSVIGDSGLESAVLQVHFESARHMQL